ncbi:MAG: hypothetical protein M3O07_00320 [Pseudomonadota bacterium]|nr:hypothetical protein [Pseudomonadota bacterium]
MSRDGPRELPILTDVVEFHATGRFPRPEQEPADSFASDLLTEADIAALQAALISRTTALAEELTREAASDIEALLVERVVDRLRAALPELVATAIRDQLAPGDD